MSKKSKGKVFVVDGNFYLHRVFFTLKTSKPMTEVLPRNFLQLVLKDACAVKATHVLVAFDGPNVFRYGVYPEYKANRSEKTTKVDNDDGVDKDVYACLPQLKLLFEDCGLILVQHKKFEADDFFASAAKQYSELGWEVIGGGKDKDGYQCLSPMVRMYDSLAKPIPKFINVAKAEKHKGVPIDQMIMYQTLLGDEIDNIPRILSPAKAKAACLKYGSIKVMYKEGTAEERKLLMAKQAQIRINRELVTLRTELALPDVHQLKPSKRKLADMPLSWYAHQDLCWPKSKGLFAK